MFSERVTTSANNLTRTILVLAVSVALVSGPMACAQGLEAGSMGSLSQASSLGPDQDSLLPPEVVPLDPAVAAKMSASQAQAQTTGGAMPETQAFPGALTQEQMSQLNGMQTAKDFRKAAFDSLMNQSQAGQWNGQFPSREPAPSQSPLVASGQAAPLGQSAWTQPGQTNGVTSHHQSQTLTGGVKTQQIRRDTKRGGFTNKVSALSAFGSGLLLGGTGFPNSAFGLGIFGLGLTGFGTRNGFRF